MTERPFLVQGLVALAALAIPLAQALATPASSAPVAAVARVAPAAPGAVPSLSPVARVEQGGIAIELQLAVRDPREVPVGSDVPVRLRVTDAASGQPLAGLRPRAWLSRLSEDVAPESCESRVRRFVGGRLAQRADQDLNAFAFVTLNQDASLTVINPLVKMNVTKLEAVVRLPGVGDDWVMIDDRDLVLVTVPSDRSVVVVDLRARRVAARIELAGEPRRILMQPDGRRAWVGLDGTGEVAVIDVESLRPVGRVQVGEGLHALTATGNGGPIAVTSTTAGQVTLIDPDTLQPRARFEVPGTPLPLAFSALSGRLYVGSVHGGQVTVIDPQAGRITGRLALERGAVALRADPSGRFVFALVPDTSRAWAIDASADRVIGSVAVADAPDQIAFTEKFGYVRGVGSIKMTLIDLTALSRGEFATNEIPMFQRDPRTKSDTLGPADMVVPAPDGDGVIVANGADASLYYYMEGMMAPQGTFQTYSRAPRALLLRDRSIREVEPGVYASRLQASRDGRYVLPVLVDSPRVVHCFDLAAVAESGPIALAVRTRSQIEAPAAAQAGASTPIRVTLTDGTSGQPLTGLDDVQLMVMQLPGLWQQRQPAREVSPGVYEIEQRLLSPGRYRVRVAVPSRAVGYEQQPFEDFDVRAAATASAPSSSATATSTVRR